jgi:hypothetical protein
MTPLRSRFDTLSSEDVTAILDLYISTLNVAKRANANNVPKAQRLSIRLKKLHPPLPNEAGADEAMGSPGPSVKAVPEEKDALSSLEDD